MNMLSKDNTISTSLHLNFLENLVNINSQSKNKEGVQQVIRLVKAELETLGFKTFLISNSVIDTAPLLIGNLNGHAKNISIISHADTVIPAHLSSFRKEGDRYLGAGIADNKAGVFIALKGIEEFLRNNPTPNFNIQFVCSPYEELGSTGFHQFFSDLGHNANLVLGFEPAFGHGDIISSRNGNKWYQLEVEGKAHHSGRAHKSHINAAHDLFRIINHLTTEVSQIQEVTLNVGQVSGGHSFNTICDKATAKIDTRFKCFGGLEKIKSLFGQDLNKFLRRCDIENRVSNIDLQVHDYCPPLELSENSTAVLSAYLGEIQSYEERISAHVHCGGAADINHFWHPDQKGFDGLGAIGGNFHRKDEFVLASSLVTRSKAFTGFLNYYNVNYGQDLH